MAKKKKSEEKKAKKELKKEKLQQKSQKKLKKRDNVKDEEDEDIETILAELEREAKARVTIVETVVGTPSRRVCGTLVSNPLNADELILFGGEFYNGQKVQLFGDLLVYNIEKKEWKNISCPNSPGPRSSHQMVLTPSGRGFIFGGEFVSSNQTTFFHYKDMWLLDLKTWAWERLEVGRKPSPRSGHRMVLWKHFIVLFGGFYDQGYETKYLDDFHVFDTQEFRWIAVAIPEPRPSKRSGFQLVLNGDTLILYGGYSKETKQGKTLGVVHSDVWHMRMTFELDKLRWERKKKGGGFVPQPRCGAPLVSFKGKGYLFGGVIDVKEDEETIESFCSDEFFQLNFEQNRFYPVQFRGRINPDAAKISPRFNSMACIQKSMLYLWGGVLEKGDQEITWADLWCINLDKLTPFDCIQPDNSALAEWKGIESDDEGDDDGSDEDDDDDDGVDDEDGESVDSESSTGSDEIPSEIGPEKNVSLDVVSEDAIPVATCDIQKLSDKPAENSATEPEGADPNDPSATDASLADFFKRTTIYWVNRVMAEYPDENHPKALRRMAFEMAEHAYKLAEPRLEVERAILRENEIKLEEAKAKRAETLSKNRRV